MTPLSEGPGSLRSVEEYWEVATSSLVKAEISGTVFKWTIHRGSK
jgi:hypothetical protein